MNQLSKCNFSLFIKVKHSNRVAKKTGVWQLRLKKLEFWKRITKKPGTLNKKAGILNNFYMLSSKTST